MSIGEHCNRNVVSAVRETTVAEAAGLLRQNHVGSVIIVDEVGGQRIPVGIVTDRDIVVEVVAAGLDPQLVKLGDLIVGPLTTISEDATYTDAIREMSLRGVRRMPVVSATGALVGIVAVDDILHRLATPLAALSDLAARGRRFEAMTRK
jgi:CBS domain-containing protein